MAIALVTGASRGIGKATALQLAREGYTVAVNYHHNIKAATDVVNQITESGGKAFALRADISDETQVMAMFAGIDRLGEPLSALVNNAGILFTQSAIEDLNAERINRVLSTNVTGYFLCCREAVKRMSHRHGGKGGQQRQRVEGSDGVAAPQRLDRHVQQRQVVGPEEGVELAGF